MPPLPKLPSIGTMSPRTGNESQPNTVLYSASSPSKPTKKSTEMTLEFAGSPSPVVASGTKFVVDTKNHHSCH